MRDIDIRPILKSSILKHYYEDVSSKVVEEMKIPVAGARIDMAVINGSLHGYEIKSASDTLQRLPNQLIAYSYIFDYLTVITEKKYYEKIVNIVPDWVGVSICTNDKKNEIEVIKVGSLNLNKHGFFIAKLLWHDELLDVLSELKLPFKKNQRNWILCETLSQNTDINILSKLVREKLKLRTDWKTKEDCLVM